MEKKAKWSCLRREWFQLTTKRLCMLGILIAMQVVLSRLLNLSITPSLRINFGFLPIAVAGMVMGPIYGAVAAALADLLGAALFPSGAILITLTLVKAVAGFNYGAWLYRRKMVWWRALLCILPVTVLCNIGLNTLVLMPIYGQAAMLAELPVRIYKNLLQYPFNVLLLYATGKLVDRLPARLTQL